MPEPPIVRWTWFSPPAAWNTSGQWQELTWAKARERIEHPDLWPGGGSLEYARNQLPGLSFARYRNDSREPTPGEAPVEGGRARVVGVWGLVVEYDDDPTITGEEVLRRWQPWRLLAFTTAHHEQPRGEQPPGPRWRVLLPFDHPVSAEEARQVGRWARHPKRLAGVVDPISEDPAAWFAAPGLGPGGYEQVSRDEGPLLDPNLAVRQLQEWLLEARLERARSVLAGTSLGERITELAGREVAQLRWPSWLGLEEVVGPLRPGMVVAVSSPVVGARRTLGLALAMAAGHGGAPVLHVATNWTHAEVVGRLLALGRGAPAWRQVSEGLVGREDMRSLADALVAACPHLHVWGPETPARHWQAIRDEWHALAEASDGPGMVIIDDPLDLDADDPRAVGLALRDLCSEGVAGRYPAVVAVTEPEIAHRLHADVHLALEPGPRGRATLTLHTADGAAGQRPVGFDPRTGRLTRLAAAETVPHSAEQHTAG